MRAALGDIVAFIDDDAVADVHWLANLIPEFEDSTVMAAAGRIMPHPSCCGGYPTFADLGSNHRVLDQSTQEWFEISVFGGIVQGSNMAFRRSCGAFWSGFNVRLGRGVPIGAGEEHFAFYELIDSGYRVVYTPVAVVFHPTLSTAEHFKNSYLSHLRRVSAYMIFLVLETNHRGSALRYFFEGLFRVKRTWRTHAVEGPSCSRWDRLKAYLSGLACYLRSGRPVTRTLLGFSHHDRS
jgi:GT2 family glycosyltransferase